MAGMPGRYRGYICRWKMRAVLLTASKKNEAGYAGENLIWRSSFPPHILPRFLKKQLAHF